MAEINLEVLGLALEAVRGTPITPPTRIFNAAGVLAARQTIWRPNDAVGELAEFQRSEVVRRWADWNMDGGMDVYSLPMLMNMVLAPVAAPTGTTAKLWEFIRVMNADTLKSATAYWGDPNQALLQSAFMMLQSFSWEADASGEEGATMSSVGMGQFPVELTGGEIPTLPAVSIGPALVPGLMQMWIDTTSAIGTTEVTGRLVRAAGTLNSGVVPKYLATGPSGNPITFTRVGRLKAHPELTVVVDMVDQVQYNLFESGARVKVRVRVNGPVISGADRHYFQQDIYGKMDSIDYGDLAGTNRTFEFTILGEKDATLGSDTRVVIQSDSATL